MLSFQDLRLNESHRKGLERIISLIPLDNFWDYITIIFTKIFLEDEKELIDKKKLKDFQQIFDALISAFYNKKQKILKNLKLIKYLLI